MKRDESFDWGQAILDLFQCESNNLIDFISSARLDPFAGDLSDADFSRIDLSNCDLTGWDLTNANFEGAILTNTNLTNAKITYSSIIKAKDWRNAIIERDRKRSIEIEEIIDGPIKALSLSSRAVNILQAAGIKDVRKLIKYRATDLRCLPGFGIQSLREVRVRLAKHGLTLNDGVRRFRSNEEYQTYLNEIGSDATENYPNE